MTSSDNLPDPDRPTPPKQKAVWPRNLALSLAAAAVAFGVVKTLEPAEDGGGGKAAGPARASAAPSAAASARPAVPLDQAFPAEVKGASGTVYTRVTAKALTSCTPDGSVGPRLSALVKQSKGCLGQQVALYKDDRDNRFSLAVLTLQDPVDTMHLVMQLSRNFTEFQVPAQDAPLGWGLPALPADSGKVQSFGAVGRAVVVGVGQWSDGRTGDFQKLVDRLDPLREAVTKNAGAHELHG
ncbi:hypothetical protein ACFVHB_30475 [Kitasatospora sp. NPDC127111]|uniref:hypothetical protein n=1 Tax=Kitasatospora sp. NPDC127111 TaxID=3345363 RepID=UPI003633564C